MSKDLRRINLPYDGSLVFGLGGEWLAQGVEVDTFDCH